MGEKWGFFLLFDAIIAHRCATMRYDSASPKTGAWPSLAQIQYNMIALSRMTNLWLRKNYPLWGHSFLQLTSSVGESD